MTNSLYEVLKTARRTGQTALMVDVKFKSPRDGELISAEEWERFVAACAEGGVDALSTPTDPVVFGGSVDVARRIKAICDVPLMRKEFFNSVEQMDESLDAGFDAVQLSVNSVAGPAQVQRMKARAEQIGLEVVIGIHDEQHLAEAVRIGAVAVGLNNRNIAALELDKGCVTRTEELMPHIPEDIFVISESALLSPADGARAAAAGADAVLVGTALAKCHDPAAMIRGIKDGSLLWP